MALRALAIIVADHPTITPDEFGSWSTASLLTGVDGVSMQDMPTYPLVPGVVLAPIQALPLGARASYLAALVMLSGFAVLAALLLRRTVELVAPGRPVPAAAAFGLALLLPAPLMTGALTWSEPTVLLWWCALCWAIAAVLVPARSPWRQRALLIGSLAAGSAPFVHGRLAAAPAVWLGVLAVALWHGDHRSDAPHGGHPEAPLGGAHDTPSRPRSRAAVLAGAALTVAILAIGRSAQRAVRAELWTEPMGHDTASLRESLGSPELWATFAATAVGQLWYMVVASFGLAVFGAIALVSMWRRHEAARHHRALAAAFAALVMSNVALSSVAMTTGGYLAATGAEVEGVANGLRWDHLFYGRYNDAATVVLAALGVLWLWSGAPQVIRRVAVVTIATTWCAAGVILVRASGLTLSGRLDAAVAGVSMVPAGSGPGAIVVWTLVGTLSAAAVALAASRGHRPLTRTLVGIVVVAAVCSGMAAARMHRSITTAPISAPVGAAPFDGAVATVASDTAQLPYLRVGVFGMQYQLLALGWSMEFSELDSGALADSPAGVDRRLLVLNDGDDPGEGWEPVAHFEGSTLWASDPSS